MGSFARSTSWYLTHGRLMGFLYATVPSLVWFAWSTSSLPWRDVYGLRLALAVVVGGFVGATVNEYGLRLWVLKHRSPDGPCTMVDGAAIGGSIGMVLTIVPAMTMLIATNHLDEVLLFIVCGLLTALVVGAAVGAILAFVGAVEVSRQA